MEPTETAELKVKPRNLPLDTHFAILNEYKQGTLLRVIAKKYGVTVSCVSILARRRGLAKRYNKGARMEPTSQDTCRTCYFYRVDPQNLRQGTCRYEPPKVFSIQVGQALSALSFTPHVEETFWCGKWKTKAWN